MSLTQFAMVEELAFLIKDNLPCKHLVLSMEETFIDFLKVDESSNVALELDPMNPYNRLLLHRLADIFGFSHQSGGEGDERHLVLERCSETSIPSILVSDFLWQYDDEHRSPAGSQIVLRVEASQGVEIEKPNLHTSIEEREAAYLSARQRIFATSEGGADKPLKQKPPSNPVVARRMIAHALGKKVKAHNEVIDNNKEYCKHIDEINSQLRTDAAKNMKLDTYSGRQTLSNNLHSKPEIVKYDGLSSLDTDTEVTTKQAEKLGTKLDDFGISEVQKANLKKEQTRAAKRMFANALGYRSGRENSLSKCSEKKE